MVHPRSRQHRKSPLRNAASPSARWPIWKTRFLFAKRVSTNSSADWPIRPFSADEGQHAAQIKAQIDGEQATIKNSVRALGRGHGTELVSDEFSVISFQLSVVVVSHELCPPISGGMHRENTSGRNLLCR